MFIMAGSMAAGRHGIAKNVYTDQQATHTKRTELGLVWDFETSKPIASAMPPPTGHTPNPSPTVSLAGDKAFKYMSLQDHSHSNPYIQRGCLSQ